MMTKQEALDVVAQFPKFEPDAAYQAGLRLLKADYPEALLPIARKLAKRFVNDARMHQLLGLAARASGETVIALDAFKCAAQLAPSDALIAHSSARVTMEAGQPAVSLFERAASLAPQDGTVVQGLGAALYRDGRSSEAMALLEQLTAANPLWLDGQRDLAHLRGQMGLPPLDCLAKRKNELRQSRDLAHLHITLALEARQLGLAASAAKDATSNFGEESWVRVLSGHIQSELGRYAEADAFFTGLNMTNSVGDASLYARHLIKAGRPREAAALLEPLVANDLDHMLWPYLSLAWRLLNNERWQWLEGDPRLIGTYNIAKKFGDMNGLAKRLRELHISKAEPLDQSVRGGTQTDGNLLLRSEPVFRRLRRALMSAVDEHVQQLPAFQADHPTLVKNREPRRISGSWSVRLTQTGHHVDHVHSQGWLSSAFYVALPPKSTTADQHDGWLALGECRELAPSLAPYKLVEPKVGQLVLFPSTMWHGTRPFPSGERMSVAFDVARPRQSKAG